MRYAGISWSERGFDLVVLDEQGGRTAQAAHFPAGQARNLIAHLRDMEEPPHCVIDSTNGLLDGMMREAGLCVYRADPRSLPARPLFGSADAGSLAYAAVSRLAELTPLDAGKGTLTGRRNEQFRETARSERSADAGALTEAGRYVKHGDRSDPAKPVALTFDDGPEPHSTGRILDILARYGVPATFFCVGMLAAAHPDLIARIAESGHEVGNHTWSHPFLPDLSERDLCLQVERTDTAIAAGTGRPASGLLRPPYGTRTPLLMSWLAEQATGHRLVLWDVDSTDWTRPGPDAITQAVLKQVKPGSIILMHDGGGDREQTARALPAIIDGLLADDYTFSHVSSLCHYPHL